MIIAAARWCESRSDRPPPRGGAGKIRRTGFMMFGRTTCSGLRNGRLGGLTPGPWTLRLCDLVPFFVLHALATSKCRVHPPPAVSALCQIRCTVWRARGRPSGSAGGHSSGWPPRDGAALPPRPPLGLRDRPRPPRPAAGPQPREPFGAVASLPLADRRLRDSQPSSQGADSLGTGERDVRPQSPLLRQRRTAQPLRQHPPIGRLHFEHGGNVRQARQTVSAAPNSETGH